MDRYLRKVVIEIQDADSSRYPFNLPAVKNIKSISFDADVTFIIGDNGAGKSTLIEAIAIACGLNPEGGSNNFRFSSRDTHSELSEHLKIVRGVRRPEDSFFMRAETFYNVASRVDDYGVTGYGKKLLHEQSHGESFIALIENRFRANGLYIMDEPEAALSIHKQLLLLTLINHQVKQHSQLIIATHSPVILSYPGAQIIEISSTGLRLVEYEDTDQYQLSRYFLNNYKAMLKEILG